MRGSVSISMTVLLAAILSAAATSTVSAKHGQHWYPHGHGFDRFLAPPGYAYIESPPPPYAAPAEAPPAAFPHAEWCGQTYQTYDPASDTYLRYDGIRVPCVGP